MASAIVVGGSGRMGRLVREELVARGFELVGSYDVDNIADLDGGAPAADVVVADNDHDGCAEAIDRFLLGGGR